MSYNFNKMMLEEKQVIFLYRYLYRVILHKNKNHQNYTRKVYLNISYIEPSILNLPSSHLVPVHPGSHPSSHCPVTWLQVLLSLQCPLHS